MHLRNTEGSPQVAPNLPANIFLEAQDMAVKTHILSSSGPTTTITAARDHTAHTLPQTPTAITLPANKQNLVMSAQAMVSPPAASTLRTELSQTEGIPLPPLLNLAEAMDQLHANQQSILAAEAVIQVGG